MPRTLVSYKSLTIGPKSDRHILFGNGFSIAYDPDLFSYDSLFELTDFGEHTTILSAIFDALGTRDFEYVSNQLKLTSAIMDSISPHYDLGSNPSDQLRELSESVKNYLAAAVIANHPFASIVVSPEQSEKCANFLTNFRTIYTTNYDLLLYWVLAKFKESIGKDLWRYFKDGFGWTSSTGGRLHWPSNNYMGQTVCYLHGALHIFPDGSGLEKLKYSENNTLVSQIRDNLNKQRLPVLVVEGSVEDKIRKIRSDPYLSRCLMQLQTCSGHLVTYGFGFKSNDNHLIDAIVNSKISTLSIGIHSEQIDDEWEQVADTMTKQRNNFCDVKRRMAEKRGYQSEWPELDVQFYSTIGNSLW